MNTLITRTHNDSYVCRNVPHRAVRNRAEFKRRFAERHLSGLRKKLDAVKVPFLVDPNTGVEMSESAEIVRCVRCVRGWVRGCAPTATAATAEEDESG